MNFRTLIRRSLRYYWRAHLGVVLGAAIGSAALVGALVVGDSVRGSLRDRALERLGWVEAAMDGGDRLFTQKLAERSSPVSPSNPRAMNSWNYDAVLRLPATAARQDGTARASQVNVFGVGYWSFWQPNRITNARPPCALVPKNGVVLNEALAARLHAQPGDEIVFRLRLPSALSGDAPISSRDDTKALRLRVHGIAPASHMGDFSLRSGPVPPLNAFLLINDLATAADLPGKANLVLAGDFRTRELPTRIEVLWWRLRAWLPGYRPVSRMDETREIPLTGWHMEAEPSLADFSLDLRKPEGQAPMELRSGRIFLDPPVVRVALAAAAHRGEFSEPVPILTYLANLLHSGTNATPYSMVTAAGPPFTPADLRDDEIVVSQWLADDLQVKAGDAIDLAYFVPDSGALLERTNRFRVRGIVPMTFPWADRTLMPDFPGLEKADSTSDWDAGFPLVHRIRQKDDDYWKQHRGTPKAFISLAAGQKMWANRFGNLTAIRFPLPTNAVSSTSVSDAVTERRFPTGFDRTETSDERTTPSGNTPQESNTKSWVQAPAPADRGHHLLEARILRDLKLSDIGLRFEPVRDQALRSVEQSQDFGQLFLGFSFFLIIAALLLMALLFRFGVEQRMAEIGTLLALGFPPNKVRRLFVGEGAALAFIGGVIGMLGGLGFAAAMLHGLGTIWRDAVGGALLGFHVEPLTLVIGLGASTIMATLVIWLTVRGMVRRPARELLAGEPSAPKPAAGKQQGIARRLAVNANVRGWISLAAALGLCCWALVRGDTANAGIFFGAGALVLVSGLSFVSAGLKTMGTCPERSKTAGERLPECSAELHSAVSQICNLPRVESFQRDRLVARPAECNSAIQQIENLRYEPQCGTVSQPHADSFGGSETPHVVSYDYGRTSQAGLPSPFQLALRGCARRRSRSLTTVAMLACGSFLIASIGVFRLDANRDATRRSSGTGGFALIGETTQPVTRDLNSSAGRDFLGLDEKDLAGVSFVPFRVHDGDEASCLNLNRAQSPRLMGVKPELLEERFSFAKGEGWQSLRANRQDKQPRLLMMPVATEEIPGVADMNSILWAMGKKVGDTLDYVDERGHPFKVRLVGAVANSILQGSVIIDEAEFLSRFPGTSGHRYFLMDAPGSAIDKVSSMLSRGLADQGMEVTPAAVRLAAFNTVQNTYLGTFQLLGGLGLLLGSAGLGVVVLRNVLERRGELAVLRAVGWPLRSVHALVLTEHAVLLAAGLGLGMVAAAIAVLPSVLSSDNGIPWITLVPTLAGVCATGFLAAWIAARHALRGSLLSALRND